jgi:hypothetical protein
MLSGEIEPPDKASAARPAKIVTAQHYDYTGRENVTSKAGIAD